MKFLKNAFTSKLADHFGLSEGDKLSGTGCAKLTYQLIAILFATGIVLFTGAHAVASVSIVVKIIVTIITMIGFFAGVKVLMRAGDILVKRATDSVNNRFLKPVVTFGALMGALVVIMAWPAGFLFVLSKMIPGSVGFAGWDSALTSGFAVLAADTLLAGLTGVSLLAGKRESVWKPVTIKPEADSTKGDELKPDEHAANALKADTSTGTEGNADAKLKADEQTPTGQVDAAPKPTGEGSAEAK